MYKRKIKSSFLVLICCSSMFASVANKPIHLDSGVQLFIDDYLIAEQSNTERVVSHPTKLSNPIIDAKTDGNFQPYVTVLRDPDTDLFRVWYGVPLSLENKSRSRCGYMESKDGINWIRPHRVLDDPDEIKFGNCVIDEGKDFSDPEKRYRWAFWKESGMKIAASPDGINWKLLNDNVVLEHNHDINCIFHDKARGRYIAMVSSYTTGPNWEGKRRVTMQSVSNDLINWQEPWYAVIPEKSDEGETQFYCMGGLLSRGRLLIGMLKVLRDDLPADEGGPVAGIGYTALAWSRDGKSWQWDRKPLIDRNHEPNTWDHAMTWADCQLPVGDNLYIYYGGYANGHKVNRFEERQIGLAIMPRDRYVARKAGTKPATITTPLLTLKADGLLVNAKIKGKLQMRIVDDKGETLKGFDYEDCKPIIGDSVRHPLVFEKSIASIGDKPVQFQFAYSDGELYGFELKSAQPQAGVLDLNLRYRKTGTAKNDDGPVFFRQEQWDAKKTAVVICDMWDKHWCKGATARVAEMAPRMNDVITKLREKGALIIHCPSRALDFYEGTPMRKRAQDAPVVETKVPLKNRCRLDPSREPPLPVDDSDGGCFCLPPCEYFPERKRQIETIEIKPQDAVTDNLEACYLMEQYGIENVIVMGVHTGMCVLDRPFAIRQMVYQGKNVVLMRDLTDCMYNPKRPPYVDHFTGTDLIVKHIEKYWCPTITSSDIIGGQPFKFKDENRDK